MNVEWECLDCGAEGIATDCTTDAWGAMRTALAQHTEMSANCPSEWAKIFPKQTHGKYTANTAGGQKPTERITPI